MLVKGFKLIKELSVVEKIEFYSLALEMYDARKSAYLCNCLYKAFSTKYFHMDGGEVIPLFNEFTAFEPKVKHDLVGWWPKENRAIRGEILVKCINQLKTKQYEEKKEA